MPLSAYGKSFDILRRGARVLEARFGEKGLAARRCANGGSAEIEVQEDRIQTRCLDHAWRARLVSLARAAEAAFGSGLDLEWAQWARVDDALYLLQSHPISTR